MKLDVSVPLGELPGLVAELPPTVAKIAPEARTILFGHLNEGNLHVNILDPVPNDGLPGHPQRLDRRSAHGTSSDALTDAVLHLVAACHGSISSEHGVGRAKARWLALSRSAEEISTMCRIKSALDPNALLNPGVLLTGRE